MKKILLAGYYGFGNLGDEAILEMVIKQLLQITERKNITVLSGNKEETSKKYDINTINRYNVFSIVKKLMKSEVLVFGGGSLLQDVTSKKSIYYYLFLIKLAHLMGCKVVLLSQGIGPILNERSKELTAKALNKVESITVRDKQSKDFLEQIGVAAEKIYLSADPVINFRADESFTFNNNSRKKVCFSLRNWKDTDVSKKISKVVEMLNEKNIECHFVPFYYNEDLELIKEIEKNVNNKAIFYMDRLSTDEAYDIVREMDLLVGVRLHSLIFAAAANVPFVAISYDHKVDHFAESVDMNVVSNINEIDIDILYDEIIKKIENEETEKDILFKNVKKLREIFNINNKILKEI